MLFVAIVYIVLLRVEFSSGTFAVPDYCENGTIPEEFLLAYRSWPHRILCDMVFDVEGYEIYDWYDYEDNPIMQCVIVDSSGSVVFNETITFESFSYPEVAEQFGYLTADVDQNLTLNYTMLAIFQSDLTQRCLFLQINLNITNLEETTCSEYSKPSKGDVPSPLGQKKQYACELGLYEFPKIHAPNVTYTWYHNCSKNLPSNVRVETDDTGRSVLHIPQLQFQNAGSYVCSATYKEETRFVPQIDVCIQHLLTFNDIVMECRSSEVLANVGETATLQCTATFGRGNLRDRQFKISLQKFQVAQNSTSENSALERSDYKPLSIDRCGIEDPYQQNVNCTVYNPMNFCYLYVPSAKQQEAPKATVHFNITFNDVEKENYGAYVITAQLTPQQLAPRNISFVLQPNPIPRLLSQTAIAGICIGVLLVFILMILIILWNSIYFRVYYKVIFGVYEIDNREFGAMLVYNFSTTNLDKFAREKIQSTVPEIRNFLESLGYRVYDENRDGAFMQGRAENIAASVERSHRVMFFLSSDILKSDWSMLTFQKSLDEMIGCRSKLIFILFPGVKQYLRQLAKKGDDSAILLIRAIKVNYSIELPENLKERRFQFEVRDAMPKLNGRPRSVSSISSHCSIPDYQNINFQRCFSNETQTTEVEEPASNHNEVLYIVEENDQEEYDDAL